MFYGLGRLLLLTCGRAAVQRAAPFYMALGIASVVIFSGQGMNAADVIRSCAGSIWFELALWAIWLGATLPAARALFGNGGNGSMAAFYLRCLPVPRWWFRGILLALLGIAELPWLILWARGAGAGAGGAALILALAAHTLLVARLRRPDEWAAALGVLAGVVLLPSAGRGGAGSGLVPGPLGLCLLVALGAPGLVLGARRAFRRAPEGGPPVHRALLGDHRSAPVALALAYAASLLRGGRAQIGRGLLLCGIGGMSVWLAARNNRVREPAVLATLSLAIGAAPLLLAVAGLGGPVLRVERGARWLLSTCGASGLVQVFSVALCLGAGGAIFGLLQGLTCGLLLGLAPMVRLRLAGEGLLAGTLLALAVTAGLRWAVRGEPRDGDRVVGLMLALVIAAPVLAWVMGELVLLGWTVAVLWSSLIAARALAPGDRHRRLRRERRAGVEP